jgi:hypothetical protein
MWKPDLAREGSAKSCWIVRTLITLTPEYLAVKTQSESCCSLSRL